MSRVTLVMLDAAYEQIHGLASSPLEQAAVIIVGRAEEGSDLRLLVREIHVVPEAAMDAQTANELRIRSEGYMHALRRASDFGAAAIFMHTHPPGATVPSKRDAIVDRQLEPVFVGRTGHEPYGSVVATVIDGALQFTGRVRIRSGWRRVDRIWSIGDRFRLISGADSPHPAPPPQIFDRQVRAFGPAFQQLLSQLTIGVVGSGGTGSPTAEQLVRMGVGRLLLFDDDVITGTNLTRIHEVVRRDVGKRKVEALAHRLRLVGTGSEIVPIVGRITTQAVAERLRACDLVFGCTDKERGRAVLNRLAYRYLTPVIDSAFIIESGNGQVRELVGRVTSLTPGQPCLLCRGRIDPERMRIEALPAAEHQAQAAQGYAPGLGDPDPAIVSFTTLVASLAVSEMIERVVGYDQPPPTELLLLMHDRRIIRSRIPPDSNHLCVRADQWGHGDDDRDTFLGMTWVD